MHGIILAGAIEGKQPFGESYLGTGTESKHNAYVSIKRAAGAYRIASFLREHDWDIEVMDYFMGWADDEFKQFIEQTVTNKTKFIALSQLFWAGEATDLINRRMAWIKEQYPDIVTIVGAKDQSIIHWVNADYHLTGYGEIGLLKLLNSITGNMITADLPIKDIEIWGTSRKVLNCDTHYPAFPCKDLQVKYEDRDFIHSDEILTLELSRGCKFKCKFCSFNVLGVKGDYSRDMENLRQEMQRNHDLWGTTMYNVADETLNDSTDKLIRARDAIKKLSFQPHMFGFARGDLIISRKDDYKYMAEMGFWGHFYGLETLNQKAGRYVGKGMSPDKLKAGLIRMQQDFPKYSPDGNFKFAVGTICGLPYEDNVSFKENHKWMVDNCPTHPINATPLNIINTHAQKFTTTLSEFDETWETSGHFKETTLEALGASPDKLPGIEWERKTMWRRITNNTALVWETDCNNWWEANLAVADVSINKEYVKDFSPSIWYLQKWLTAQKDGLTLKDMHRPVRDLGGFGDERYEGHLERIGSYIKNKLNSAGVKSHR